VSDPILPPRLSEQQGKLLRAIYAGLRQQGKWPTVYRVDKVLDTEGLSLEEVAATLPSGLTNVSSRPFNGNDEATLTPAGLTYVPEASDDAGVFIQILWLAIKEEQGYEPPTDGSPTEGPLITSEQLQKNLGLSIEQLKRIHNIIRWEPWCGSGGWGDDRFDFHVTREVRRFRGVQNLREYAERKAQRIHDAYGQQARPQVPHPLLVPQWPTTIPQLERTYPASVPRPEPAEIPEPAEAIPKVVFVMMPLDDMKDALYREIREACETVGVRCLRADEIERSGRITEQIYEAIANADALVADIGGRNANVMYELGYAHALKKEVIILNDEHEAPFDIKDFRWIVYEIDDLSEPMAKLPRFIRNTLRLDEPEPEVSPRTTSASQSESAGLTVRAVANGPNVYLNVTSGAHESIEVRAEAIEARPLFEGKFPWPFIWRDSGQSSHRLHQDETAIALLAHQVPDQHSSNPPTLRLDSALGDIWVGVLRDFVIRVRIRYGRRSGDYGVSIRFPTGFKSFPQHCDAFAFSWDEEVANRLNR